MAHEISFAGGKGAEFAYAGASPWHSLGNQLPGLATGIEIEKAAHMDWTVSKQPIYRADGSKIEKHVAIVRDDIDSVLGILGDGFRPVQNRELFEIGDAVIGEAGAFYETAGALKGGKKVFALIRLPHFIEVTPDDQAKPFLLLANGHDGSQALTGLLTATRVVCNNTLTVALQGISNRVYVRHTESADVRIADVKRILGLSKRYYEIAGQKFQALTNFQINDQILQGYLNAVVPIPVGNDVPEESTKRAETAQERIAFLFKEGRGNQLPGVKGSAWALFNGVTEWVDHVNVLTQAGKPKKNGAEWALFGAGQELRQKAYDTAVALLDAEKEVAVANN